MATPSEPRPREFPWVNPERMADLLRRIIKAWDRPDIDRRRQEELVRAIAEAKRLFRK